MVKNKSNLPKTNNKKYNLRNANDGKVINWKINESH